MADSSSASVFLRLLAERAAADPAYLAWVVRTYAETERRPSADVLWQLGIDESIAADFLVSLRPTGERFGEMLKVICARFGAHEAVLLAVLREVEVLDAFRTRPASGSSTGAADAGLLMAARMREERDRQRAGRQAESPRQDEREEGRDDKRGEDDGNDAR